ncbi:MAG: glycosyltransferase [Cyanobacteriota bacterium]|nr:glycosyltransferase [Cyanobacteriota bacterium]
MSALQPAPKVSVIIPIYNGDRYIAEAIESVLNQTYTNYEIIVIDDGSTDKTRQVLEPYFDVIRYIYQENRGLSATRNRGIEIATGEFIALLDCDDIFLPYKLAEEIAIFQQQPSLALVQSGWCLIDENGKYIEDVEFWRKSPNLDLEDWLLWQATLPSGMIFRRRWLLKIGGFNDKLRKMEDLDIVLRLALAGGRSAWLKKPAVCYRQHTTNLSQDRPGYTRALEELLDNFFAKKNLPENARQIEQRVRYGSLVWNSWRLYKTGHAEVMAEYLKKSLQYSKFTPRKTISNWVSNFIYFAADTNTPFQTSQLRKLPAWQELINSILPQKTPRVSIVIGTYNNAEYIEEAIDSILNQTYNDFEIIIINDGSTDNTAEVLEPYLDVIKYQYRQNQGVAKARNNGISISSGELIAFLDSDDFFMPEKLAEQVAVFEENSSLTMVQTGWRFVTEEGEGIKDAEPWKQAPELDVKSWLFWQATLPSAMMFRREWLEIHGGFDGRYFPVEDLDIVLRLALSGGKAGWLKKPLVCYRQHGSSASGLGNRKGVTKSQEKLFNDFFPNPDLPEEIKELENKVRYNSLIWNSWRLYNAGNWAEMAYYLRKSLPYSGLNFRQTIVSWLSNFIFFAADSNDADFDLAELRNSPEWQQLINSILPPEAPRVSIVIGTYNNGKYIKETTDSILDQTYENYEIIIINDGSTDNTEEVLAPYLDVIRYVYQPNQGVAKARNLGIKMARGEFVAFVDSDDVFMPEKLEEQLAVFEEDNSLTMVQTGWRFVDEKGEGIRNAEPWKNAPELDLKSWLFWQATLPSAMMFRREWLEIHGGFDGRYFPVEDLDIVLRLALSGGKAAWLKKPLVCYRQHGSSASGLGNRKGVTKSLEKLFNDFFPREDLPEEIKELEIKVRYGSLIWNSWRLYKAGNLAEMAFYLRKSLAYTEVSKTEAISSWIATFASYDRLHNSQFDVLGLSQSPEWRELIGSVLNPPIPRVSVIIATYNNAGYIEEAIASVLNQTFTNYEIIVVDDGSTDNTRQVLEPYLDKIRYIYQENQGVSKARNLGLEMARGEFISFLDADDFFLPDKLGKQVGCFDSRPGLGIVHSGWRLVNEKGKLISDIELWRYGDTLDISLETWVIWKPVTISMMFRREWIQKVGGFNTRWRHGEDVDLVFRMALKGCEAVWLPKVTYCYRQHTQNATRKSFQQGDDMNAMLNNFFGGENLPEEVRQWEGKSRYYTLCWLAWQAHRNGFLGKMVEYLRQALKYTPLSLSETVFHWLESFNNLYQQYGYEFDAYSLTSSEEWKELMSGLVGGISS